MARAPIRIWHPQVREDLAKAYPHVSEKLREEVLRKLRYEHGWGSDTRPASSAIVVRGGRGGGLILNARRTSLVLQGNGEPGRFGISAYASEILSREELFLAAGSRLPQSQAVETTAGRILAACPGASIEFTRVPPHVTIWLPCRTEDGLEQVTAALARAFDPPIERERSGRPHRP